MLQGAEQGAPSLHYKLRLVPVPRSYSSGAFAALACLVDKFVYICAVQVDKIDKISVTPAGRVPSLATGRAPSELAQESALKRSLGAAAWPSQTDNLSCHCASLLANVCCGPLFARPRLLSGRVSSKRNRQLMPASRHTVSTGGCMHHKLVLIYLIERQLINC